jgi:lipoate-protein ligase A
MTARGDREWRLIREQARDGPLQMALDEVAAETAVKECVRTVRVYRWRPRTLSLGYRQDPTTVDWAGCADAGVSVTRRQTGGGGIYHDAYGDISYSIVAPADELPGDLMECYELLCEPILTALDRMGVDADFADAEHPSLYEPACYLRGIHPAHDVLAGGRKIAGNAQYRQRDAVIQHGSLSYAVDAEAHLAAFADSGVSPERFRERVTGIREESGIERERAVEVLEETLAEWADADEGDWTDAELDRARALAAEKYGADRWVRDREAPRAGGE